MWQLSNISSQGLAVQRPIHESNHGCRYLAHLDAVLLPRHSLCFQECPIQPDSFSSAQAQCTQMSGTKYGKRGWMRGEASERQVLLVNVAFALWLL